MLRLVSYIIQSDPLSLDATHMCLVNMIAGRDVRWPGGPGRANGQVYKTDIAVTLTNFDTMPLEIKLTGTVVCSGGNRGMCVVRVRQTAYA